MMRHVSRTNRVALDWLFARINLDPTIQIRYMDSKHQLSDLLVNGGFTRDEWCNLLCLVNIMNLPVFSRINFRSVEKATTMSKRIQERKEEAPAEAKPRSVCFISTSWNKVQYSAFCSVCFQYPRESAAGFGVCRRSRGELQARHCPKQSPKP